MKKNTIQFIAISVMFLFVACSDAGTKETSEKTKESNTTEDSKNVQIVDSAKKTTVTIGPEGVSVKSKNNDVEVKTSGVNVGTKDVKVDIKSGK